MPDWGPEIGSRLSSVRLSPAREAEIVEELSQHLEDRWRELLSGGADPDVATRLALTEFRGTDVLGRYLAPLRQAHWADPSLPVGRGFFLAGVMTDLRDAVRSLRATPGFTIVALLVLTLGIGATTAIFSVVDAVVLRGLPFDEHDRLVAVGERGTFGKGNRQGPPQSGDAADPQAIRAVQPQNYLDWIVQQSVFESMAARWSASPTLRLPGADPEEVVAEHVTASFFDVLRIRPAIGRPFTADNEVDGRHRVAILSDALWHRRFGANPEIVGRTIPLDDGAYEIAGIMPVGVTYPVGALLPTDLWVPYVVPASQRTRGHHKAAPNQQAREHNGFTIVTKLTAGTTILATPSPSRARTRSTRRRRRSERAANGSARLIADHQHERRRIGQMVRLAAHDPAAGALAGAGEHHPRAGLLDERH
jgi:putative ABC transport system permease protein